MDSESWEKEDISFTRNVGCIVKIPSKIKITTPRNAKYQPNTRRRALIKLAFSFWVCSSISQALLNLLPRVSLKYVSTR